MSQDETIGQFCEVTGADANAARHFLEAANWDLAVATGQFFEGGDEDAAMTGTAEQDDDAELYSTPQPASTSSSAGASAAPARARQAGGARVTGFGDIKRGQGSGDDEDDRDKKQDFFAGGEKSGLAVQNPNAGQGRAGGGDIIQDILKRAAEGGQRQRDDEPEAPRQRFGGTGFTLGSDETPSQTIPDPNAAAPQQPAPPQSVTRQLTFWRDGFSVEDGPLYRYDDPANREILNAIEQGRAPLSLMNVEPGQPADVNVFKRLDEDYVATKKKFVPFSGSGQRLGSVAPGESSSSSSAPAPAAAAVPAPAAAARAAPPSMQVDEAAPATRVQIRLADGTRLATRFNHSHTVGDMYAFVNAGDLDSRSRGYVLMTTFPNKELKQMDETIKDAGLINAVVVQKWN